MSIPSNLNRSFGTWNSSNSTNRILEQEESENTSASPPSMENKSKQEVGDDLKNFLILARDDHLRKINISIIKNFLEPLNRLAFVDGIHQIDLFTANVSHLLNQLKFAYPHMFALILNLAKCFSNVFIELRCLHLDCNFSKKNLVDHFNVTVTSFYNLECAVEGNNQALAHLKENLSIIKIIIDNHDYLLPIVNKTNKHEVVCIKDYSLILDVLTVFASDFEFAVFIFQEQYNQAIEKFIIKTSSNISNTELFRDFIKKIKTDFKEIKQIVEYCINSSVDIEIIRTQVKKICSHENLLSNEDFSLPQDFFNSSHFSKQTRNKIAENFDVFLKEKIEALKASILALQNIFKAQNPKASSEELLIFIEPWRAFIDLTSQVKTAHQFFILESFERIIRIRDFLAAKMQFASYYALKIKKLDQLINSQFGDVTFNSIKHRDKIKLSICNLITEGFSDHLIRREVHLDVVNFILKIEDTIDFDFNQIKSVPELNLYKLKNIKELKINLINRIDDSIEDQSIGLKLANIIDLFYYIKNDVKFADFFLNQTGLQDNLNRDSQIFLLTVLNYHFQYLLSIKEDLKQLRDLFNGVLAKYPQAITIVDVLNDLHKWTNNKSQDFISNLFIAEEQLKKYELLETLDLTTLIRLDLKKKDEFLDAITRLNTILKTFSLFKPLILATAPQLIAVLEQQAITKKPKKKLISSSDSVKQKTEFKHLKYAQLYINLIDLGKINNNRIDQLSFSNGQIKQLHLQNDQGIGNLSIYFLVMSELLTVGSESSQLYKVWASLKYTTLAIEQSLKINLAGLDFTSLGPGQHGLFTIKNSHAKTQVRGSHKVNHLATLLQSEIDDKLFNDEETQHLNKLENFTNALRYLHQTPSEVFTEIQKILKNDSDSIESLETFYNQSSNIIEKILKIIDKNFSVKNLQRDNTSGLQYKSADSKQTQNIKQLLLEIEQLEPIKIGSETGSDYNKRQNLYRNLLKDFEFHIQLLNDLFACPDWLQIPLNYTMMISYLAPTILELSTLIFKAVLPLTKVGFNRHLLFAANEYLADVPSQIDQKERMSFIDILAAFVNSSAKYNSEVGMLMKHANLELLNTCHSAIKIQSRYPAQLEGEVADNINNVFRYCLWINAIKEDNYPFEVKTHIMNAFHMQPEDAISSIQSAIEAVLGKVKSRGDQFINLSREILNCLIHLHKSY